MRYLLIKLILAYQWVLSPLLPPACRFIPTCSEYARECLLLHGSGKGMILVFFRLLRCNPFFASGLDPVPEKFSLKSILGATKEHGHT
ncbi:membrane protein insertion efficiency factor YidD [Desulfonatronospira sp.]|uniref:membrane protein insertion efficiency factor YidD n=1 Tax=Desulfonatronospira sp. TaxID=1962951 RepID=UPI0025B9D51B|nr:membrane protein insertion efficiency factor YidD [Desulfonatronospira sp.]